LASLSFLQTCVSIPPSLWVEGGKGVSKEGRVDEHVVIHRSAGRNRRGRKERKEGRREEV